MADGTGESLSYLDRFRSGDEDAARELFNKYVEQLLQLARHRISHRLAQRIDAEDVVQSVFRTFFKHAQAGEFVLRDQDDLSKLLVRITMYKTLRQIAHHQQAKRDARQETGKGDDHQEHMVTIMAQGPSPEETVIFLDQLDHLLNQLTEEDRRICQMRIEGHTNVDIAKELGINERRIRRLMERLRGLAKKEDWFD